MMFFDQIGGAELTTIKLVSGFFLTMCGVLGYAGWRLKKQGVPVDLRLTAALLLTAVMLGVVVMRQELEQFQVSGAFLSAMVIIGLLATILKGMKARSRQPEKKRRSEQSASVTAEVSDREAMLLELLTASRQQNKRLRRRLVASERDKEILQLKLEHLETLHQLQEEYRVSNLLHTTETERRH